MSIVPDDELKKLENISNKARKLIIENIYYCKGGHPGGSLSSIDILTTLYFNIMNINPEEPYDENRDRFILSKGHSSIALYTTLALRGYFNIEELKTFDKINSRLQAHPDMRLLPGIDFSTGSLGQGISAAVGMALGAKLKNKDFKVYCMIGDGECQEGQIWEALDFASRYNLNNLIIILDYNKLQQYGFNNQETIINPCDKFESFGINVLKINGHNFENIITANYAATISKKPLIIIAETIKGKGISFMENEKSWHSRIPTEEEYKLALKELGVN
jgi:transketolase